MAAYGAQAKAKRAKSGKATPAEPTLLSNVVLKSGVWQNVTITQKDGKRSLFVNGVNVSGIDGLTFSKNEDPGLTITYQDVLLATGNDTDWTLSCRVKNEPTAAPQSGVLNLL